MDYGLRIKERMQDVLGTLVNATQKEDQDAVAKELQFFVNCNSCGLTLDYIKEFVYDTVNRKVILQFLDISICQSSFAQFFCIEFFKVIDKNLDLAFNTTFQLVLSKDYVCHYVFRLCEQPKFKELSLEDYRLDVLRDKPAIILDDEYIDKLYLQIEKEDDEVPDSYNIIQITDWHIDFNYLEGTNKKCNYEICCQKEWGMAETPSEAARKYGELTCDIPYITAVK